MIVRYIFRLQKAKISTNVKTKRSYTKEVGNAKSHLVTKKYIICGF